MKYLISLIGMILAVQPQSIYANDIYVCAAECMKIDYGSQQIVGYGNLVATSRENILEAYENLNSACQQAIADNCEDGVPSLISKISYKKTEIQQSHHHSSTWDELGMGSKMWEGSIPFMSYQNNSQDSMSFLLSTTHLNVLFASPLDHITCKKMNVSTKLPAPRPRYPKYCGTETPLP